MFCAHIEGDSEDQLRLFVNHSGLASPRALYNRCCIRVKQTSIQIVDIFEEKLVTIAYVFTIPGIIDS